METTRPPFMGYAVGAVINSRFQHWAPLEQAALYALMPVTREARQRKNSNRTKPRYFTEQQLIHFKLERQNGKVIAVRKRVHRPRQLAEEAQQANGPAARPYAAYQQINPLLGRPQVSPFSDLPVYLDYANASFNGLDWDALERDVYRGLTGALPFTYELAPEAQKALQAEMPFMDFDEHFRSAVAPEIVKALMQQLLKQYTEEWYGKQLVPLRWVARVTEQDILLAHMEAPRVLVYGRSRPFTITSGAYNVVLQP